MDDVPLQVTIPVPAKAENLNGRYSTAFPYGTIVSLRLPHAALQAIERARKLSDPGISRALFMRMAAVRVAEAINDHHDTYLRTKTNERDT